MPKPDLASVVSALVGSYRSDPRGHRKDRRYLPSKTEIVGILESAFAVFFPGYYGAQDVTEENVAYHVGSQLVLLQEKLSRQIEQCLCHAAEAEIGGAPEAVPAVGDCSSHAKKLSAMLLAKLPELRGMLLEDMQAAFDGDPAAQSLDEVVLAYPGFLAITVYRFAHELFEMGVPLMPRIMSEWAHERTGCDIHPGARIGRRFFIDHATGTVVGETSLIGNDVKLYQGVTLGALSHPRDELGRVIRNVKRHPTVEDGVTIYANATVLGGATVIGRGSLVGGGVFVTKSVPPSSRIALKAPELSVRQVKDLKDWVLDFDI
jgi:serine O-acetyltransferase